MQGGDISNQYAPAIAIDVDGLVILTEKKILGLITRQFINPNAIGVCDYHFRHGRSIYLLAKVDKVSKEEQAHMERILDAYDFPYTRLFLYDEPSGREAVLGRNHVHHYYYMEKLNGSTDNKRKEKRIYNISEIYF